MAIHVGDSVMLWCRSLNEVVKGKVTCLAGNGSIRCEFVDERGMCFGKTLAIKEVVAEEVRNRAVQSMRQAGIKLQYAHSVLQRDEEVVRAAVTERGAMLKYASKHLQDHKGVVLAAVREHGMALQHASKTLRNDKEVVLAAVRQDVRALQHASTALQNNKEVVLAVVRQDVTVLSMVSKALRTDRDFMLLAIEQNPQALKLALKYHQLSESYQRRVLGLRRDQPIVYPWHKRG